MAGAVLPVVLHNSVPKTDNSRLVGGDIDNIGILTNVQQSISQLFIPLLYSNLGSSFRV